MGIKLVNNLPQDIKKFLYDVSKFKAVTKCFLFFLRESIYSIKEYFEWSDK
jgi:hypothetical protein